MIQSSPNTEFPTILSISKILLRKRAEFGMGVKLNFRHGMPFQTKCFNHLKKHCVSPISQESSIAVESHRGIWRHKSLAIKRDHLNICGFLVLLLTVIRYCCAYLSSLHYYEIDWQDDRFRLTFTISTRMGDMHIVVYRRPLPVISSQMKLPLSSFFFLAELAVLWQLQ